jgi:hypothetical protein
MVFTTQVLNGHEIRKVQFSAGDLAQARTQAEAKVPFTNANNPAARTRTTLQVRNSQLLGTLADLACANLISDFFTARNVPLSVQRYDDIRTDRFQNPHPYSIRVLGPRNTCHADIEVRSSVCNRISVARMIDIWHVLGWYITAARPDDTLVDFYMRPIFHFNRFNTDTYSLDNLERYFDEGAIDLYIVGGATRTQLVSHGEIQRGYGLLQEGATYQVLPIRQAMDVPAFLTAIEAHTP